MILNPNRLAPARFPSALVPSACPYEDRGPFSADLRTPVLLRVHRRGRGAAHTHRHGDGAMRIIAHSQLDRKLIYTIVEGKDEQTFAVEHEEGLVRLQDVLDYEGVSFYSTSSPSAPPTRIRTSGRTSSWRCRWWTSTTSPSTNWGQRLQFSQYVYNVSLRGDGHRHAHPHRRHPRPRHGRQRGRHLPAPAGGEEQLLLLVTSLLPGPRHWDAGAAAEA